MIEFRDVSIQKEKFALQNISLKIKKGEVYAILGPSGAGKSTLVKALLGLEKLSSGAIFYENKEITYLSVQKRGFGYVPQTLALFPHLSIQDNLLFNHKKQPALFNKLIKVANIAHLLKRYPTSLSGGEKQRVALVRALLSNSKVLILDEPFSALDISLKKELWFVVKSLQKEFALTVLLITHDLNEAYFLSDKVAVLQNGKLLQNEDTKELFRRPKCVEVASYLGMKNIFNLEPKKNNEIFVPPLQQSFKIKSELKSNITHIIIPSVAITFEKEKSAMSLEGDFELLEFQNYNIILFKIFGTKAILEIEVSKEEKPSSFITLHPEEFIYVTSCN